MATPVAPRHRPVKNLAFKVGVYVRRVWDNSGEDNIFFLASGIAFNLLLAAIPFLLLMVSGLAYVLDRTPEMSTGDLVTLIERLLPPQPEGVSPVRWLLSQAATPAKQIGIISAITFVWFSTRLFGSLRAVLADVFDIEADRGIIAGKIFDMGITVAVTILVIAYMALSAYVELATPVLTRLGLRADVMGRLEYLGGRTLAFSFIALMFFLMYKYLPKRRTRSQAALVAALVTSALLEVAKVIFTLTIRTWSPGSMYTGTILTVASLVSWVYYAAFLFILGGEIAQVYEMRHLRRRQRTVLD